MIIWSNILIFELSLIEKGKVELKVMIIGVVKLLECDIGVNIIFFKEIDKM